jgi:hypothetical protein
MMHRRDPYEGLVQLAVAASTCGQVSINATRCDIPTIVKRALSSTTFVNDPG